MTNEIDINELREQLASFLTLDQTGRDALIANLLNWLLERVSGLEAGKPAQDAAFPWFDERLTHLEKHMGRVLHASSIVAEGGVSGLLAKTEQVEADVFLKWKAVLAGATLLRNMRQLMATAQDMATAISQDTVDQVGDLCEQIDRDLSALEAAQAETASTRNVITLQQGAIEDLLASVAMLNDEIASRPVATLEAAQKPAPEPAHTFLEDVRAEEAYAARRAAVTALTPAHDDSGNDSPWVTVNREDYEIARAHLSDGILRGEGHKCLWAYRLLFGEEPRPTGADLPVIPF
jgi:hypothetical protein